MPLVVSTLPMGLSPKQKEIVIIDGDEDVLDNFLQYGERLYIENKHVHRRDVNIHKHGILRYGEKIIAIHEVTGEWVTAKVGV